jgi:hypothetical protein
MLSCRVFGHDYRFWSEGTTMHWACARGCGEEHSKTYSTAAEASRYAQAFDRDDRQDLGKRAPLSLFPLRFGRAARRRR